MFILRGEFKFSAVTGGHQYIKNCKTKNKYKKSGPLLVVNEYIKIQKAKNMSFKNILFLNVKFIKLANKT